MPQMSPMLWIYIFMFETLIFLIFLMKLYFITMNLKIYFPLMNFMNKKFYWKWN
nr:ATP synthase F0 subunit 8 [Osmia brevicornis]